MEEEEEDEEKERWSGLNVTAVESPAAMGKSFFVRDLVATTCRGF